MWLRLTLAAMVSIATRAHAEDGPARYLALGDSYTIGESVPASERWPVQLTRLLRADGLAIDEPQIIARTGWTTDELNVAIDDAAPRGPYALVTLLIGVNNQYRGRDAEEYRQQFVALLRRAIGFAGERPERVIVVSIPDWGVTPFAAKSGRDVTVIARELDTFNRINREEATRAGAAWVDVTAISRRPGHEPAYLADDGLHPSGRQYALWAQAVAPVARERLSR